MYFDDEQQLPALVPIKKKKNEVNPIEEQRQQKNNQEKFNVFDNQNTAKKAISDNKKEEDKKVEKDVKPSLTAQKVEEIEKKFKAINEKSSNKIQERDKKKADDKERQNQKSKFLIAEMMKKINAKNISEELYPVTNETIEQLIKKIDRQIEQLKLEAERKQNSLITNPNNQHLKKQLESLRISIDRCVTIKQLYHEKINLRNKNSILQKSIIGLREENQNLKIKISRGVQTIQNHMHNLPCERQKQLKDELKKCTIELNKQKQMRQKLEGNVSQIILNFKRLYDEADTARLIVTKKLKQIQERQKKMIQPQENQNQIPTSDKKTQQQQQEVEDKKPKKVFLYEDKKIKTGQTTSSDFKGTNKQKQGSTYSLEEQIKKMRGNQNNFGKSYK